MTLPPFLASVGEKTKARDIIAAIRTLKLVEQEHRQATPGEHQVLSRFGGFGPVALSIFPDPLKGTYKDGWESLGQELKSLLTTEEYDSAKRSTYNAFYTSSTVISAIHEAITRLGIPKDATVLEPGCGNGNFMCGSHHYIGVELEDISGRIARLLHPQADIRIENFRDTILPPIDAVVGNVPFADVKINYKGQKLSLHDFFITKSVDALRPGGVLALVTSHFTLDKQNAAVREYLASKADFLGAIRLPSDAFKREGTAVVTDIVFLRKRGDEPAQHADPEWLGVAPVTVEGSEVGINRYFLNHPEMVLGTLTRKDTLYGGEGYSVTGNGDLAEQLKTAIQRFPKMEDIFAQSYVSPTQSQPAFTPPPAERHITEGSFFIQDGTVCQSVGGQSSPVTYGGTLLKSNGTMTGKRLAALIGLRDHARRVLQSQNEGWPEANRIEVRQQLNWAYDRFVGKYGPINKTTFSETVDGSVIRRMPNIVKFKEDLP